MKRIIRIMGLCALVAIAATACKKEAQTTSTLKATLTQPTSNAKTHLSGSDLHWNSGDAIKVFDAVGNDYLFTTTDANQATATFTSNEAVEVVGSTAFYPAANAEKQGNDILLTLPATQDYAEGTFGNATYPMAALYNATTGFTFGSPCGLLAIPVKGTGNISSIELTSRTANEVLAGQLRYNLSGDYQNLVGTETTVTLNCGGLSLSSTATTFYFVLPAGVFANGFTAVLKNGTTELYTLEAKQADVNTIAAQSIKLMPEVEVQAIAVTTGDATSISKTSATLNGEYVVPTTAQGMNVTEVGFYFGEDASAMTATSVTLGNPFSLAKTGLTAGTTYYYKAYAKNGTREYEGPVMNFTTLAAPAATTGTTGHEEPTISSTTAVCYGELASLSGITEYGICWSTENFSFSKDASVTYVASTNWEGGVFSATIPVAANGTYYYCAYAINAVGTGYGEIKTFTVTWNGNLAELTGSEPAGYATATDGMTIYGSLNENVNVKVSIAADASVTLSNATITGENDDDYSWAGLTCLGNATIVLADGTTNNVKGFYENYPGISFDPGKTLTIQGTGTLNASSNGWGAGIGGNDEEDCGNIVINNGIINATGGDFMAGIGGGYTMNCGNITINGGTVTATGGRGAAGIGLGYAITDITCGDISITGGIVNATGGLGAAGIGSGFVHNSSTNNDVHNTCGNISITGGQVTATGGNGGDHAYPDIMDYEGWTSYSYNGGAGIGTGSTVNDSGANAASSSCGNICITGGQVTATKGGGTRPATNSIGKNESSYNHGTCGTITIGGTEYPSGATPNQGDGLTFVYPVPAPVIPAGAINSIFNVGTSASPKYVYFSQGNLQYSQSADKWSFMEHQYDMVETTGMDVGTNYADQDIVSLFGWGTGNNPTKTGGGAAEYENYTEWGTNTIYSGTTATTNWRTLTRDEWNNLFANHQYGYVMISNGSQWICGVAIDPSSTTTLNTDHSHWSDNIYWTGLDAFIADAEAGGWLFLPAAGLRTGTNVTKVSDPVSGAGYYWSSTKEYDSLLEFYQSNYLYFKSNDDAMIKRNSGFYGHSVRLVKDAE